MLKQLAIIGGALVVVGAIGLGVEARTGHGITFPIAINSTGFSSVSLKSPSLIHEEKTVSAMDVTNISVNSDISKVEVLPQASKQAAVVLNGTSSLPQSDFHLSAKVVGHTLQVVLNTETHVVNGSNNITLEISVPQRTYQSVGVNDSVGTLDIHDISAKSSNFQVDTGKITVENVTGSITASSSVGAIQVTNCSGALNLSTQTGAINVTVPKIVHSIKANGSIGAVTITSQSAPEHMTFDLQTDTGKVTANVPGATYSTNRLTRITGSVGTGGPQVTAATSIGSVTLN